MMIIAHQYYWVDDKYERRYRLEKTLADAHSGAMETDYAIAGRIAYS